MNQCQGCQAGWPVKTEKLWPFSDETITFHEVIGGYKGEIVLCTRDRYEEGKK